MIDRLACFETTLDELRRRGWTNTGAGTLDGADAVSLVTAVEIATNGRVGAFVSDEYRVTILALAIRVVLDAERKELPPPLLAWSMRRVPEPSWLAAEQLLEHWESDGRRCWADIEHLLDELIDEAQLVEDEGPAVRP